MFAFLLDALIEGIGRAFFGLMFEVIGNYLFGREAY